MRAIILLTGLAVALPLWAQVIPTCACSPGDKETWEARECSLAREAAKQEDGQPYFYLKDINPRKPNRWLALPRQYYVRLSDMPPRERAGLWKAAIAKARELWGDEWGLAVNGDERRTQCHIHIHIGKLLQGVETERFITVNSVEQIPAPSDGTGLWVYYRKGRFYVHLDEQLTETVLLR